MTPTDDGERGPTLAHTRPAPLAVRRFRLVLVGDEARRPWESAADRCAIGSHSTNDLVIDDATVSRFHCELQVSSEGVLARDLGSRNGTLVDGVQIKEAMLRDGSLVQLGRASVRLELSAETNRLVLSDRTELGGLVGVSPAMRACFASLERAAPSDATVLLEGETGTGKSATAEAIHLESARADGPFVVVDCSAMPAQLLESELFGHEKGAFTGAVARRLGAFEEANGGTVFIDEIGELPPELQPKLLRVIEDRQVRPVGSNQLRKVDVRLVVATHRDLRADVNSGRFRADLYFRVAVIHITVPPLRQRLEDLPLLVKRLLERFPGARTQWARLLAPEFLGRLQSAAWPGNVRELRNYLERCLVFQDVLPVSPQPAPDVGSGIPVDLALPFSEARQKVIDELERRYLTELLRKHGRHTVAAAQAAGLDRVYLYRLLRRHGLR